MELNYQLRLIFHLVESTIIPCSLVDKHISAFKQPNLKFTCMLTSIQVHHALTFFILHLPKLEFCPPEVLLLQGTDTMCRL